jgi:LysM repeat protein
MSRRQRVGSTLAGLTLLGLAVFVGCSSCATGKAPQKTGEVSSAAEGTPAATVRDVRTSVPADAEVSAIPVPFYPTPARMDLCGEPVPLEVQDVHERFDREFTIVVYNHGQVYLWLKRMERYFPWIEEKIRQYRLPEDLKYVAIAESDLLPEAYSPKGAAGPWQFIPSTGGRYGLDQQGSVDHRYDFEKATDSAFRYLQDLYRLFKNWTVAIGAYNCGEKRMQDTIQYHRTSDFYQLKLPQETERYIMRILAIKAVLGNPARYGYSLPRGSGYAELRVDRVRINLAQPVSIHSAAAAAGITFREFKRLNPVFRADQIPPGSFDIKLPEGTAMTFQRNFETAKAQTGVAPAAAGELSSKPAEPKADPPKAPAKAPAVISHTVKRGETLSSIAQHYKVNVTRLREVNQLRRDQVNIGEILKIPQE